MSVQGTIATSITQPVDVMKTRLMEAKPGQYKVNSILEEIFLLQVNLSVTLIYISKDALV